MSALSYADVIAEQQQRLGASALHVTLGPQATPEALRGELNRLADEIETYAAYEEVERLGARAARLEALLDEINQLATAGHGVGGDPAAALNRIGNLTEMIPDADLTEDIACMAREREKAGRPLPVPVPLAAPAVA